jgi:hypothetical protein
LDSQSPVIPAEAISALKNGRKIEAIKITRSETGMGLKESKEAVERYVASVPEFSERFQSRGNWPLLLLVLAVVAIAIYLSGVFG